MCAFVSDNVLFFHFHEFGGLIKGPDLVLIDSGQRSEVRVRIYSSCEAAGGILSVEVLTKIEVVVLVCVCFCANENNLIDPDTIILFEVKC